VAFIPLNVFTNVTLWVEGNTVRVFLNETLETAKMIPGDRAAREATLYASNRKSYTMWSGSRPYAFLVAWNNAAEATLKSVRLLTPPIREVTSLAETGLSGDAKYRLRQNSVPVGKFEMTRSYNLSFALNLKHDGRVTRNILAFMAGTIGTGKHMPCKYFRYSKRYNN
jgi:hypothetical protein